MRCRIWRDALGPFVENDLYGFVAGPNSNDFWIEVHDALAREKGVFALAPSGNPFERCATYLLDASEIDDILDLIEVTFRLVHGLGALDELRWKSQASQRDLRQRPRDAIEELNVRLREAGVGYQFETDQIIRVDSQYVHAEAVKPALILLSDERFRGAHEEFLHAHQLYSTAGLNEDKKRENAITDALKALESTLKVICDLMKWSYPSNARAAALIKVVIEGGLIPSFLQSSLEGLATLRNNIGAHGQGGQTRSVPPHLAAYALHLAASNIVMLIEAFKESEQRP